MRRIILSIFCTLLIGCDGWNNRSSVPFVPVQYTLYITREHPNFVVEHGFQTMTVTQPKFEREYLGYAGLLIWVGIDGNYHAADLCCPHCLLKSKPVKIDGLYAVCPQCEEAYDLSFGYAFPTKGISKETLRRYQTSYTGSMSGYTLRIFN